MLRDNLEPNEAFKAAVSSAMDLMVFKHAIKDETDRGAILMVAGYVEEKLKQLLSAALVNDAKVQENLIGDKNKPLSTLSSRIDAAYALGLIPKEAWKDLHTIRNIRNNAAHTPKPIHFEDDSIRSRCAHLANYGMQSLETVPTVREKFLDAAFALLVLIHASRSCAVNIKPREPIPESVWEKAKRDSELFTNAFQQGLEESLHTAADEHSSPIAAASLEKA